MIGVGKCKAVFLAYVLLAGGSVCPPARAQNPRGNVGSEMETDSAANKRSPLAGPHQFSVEPYNEKGLTTAITAFRWRLPKGVDRPNLRPILSVRDAWSQGALPVAQSAGPQLGGQIYSTLVSEFTRKYSRILTYRRLHVDCRHGELLFDTKINGLFLGLAFRLNSHSSHVGQRASQW